MPGPRNPLPIHSKEGIDIAHPELDEELTGDVYPVVGKSKMASGCQHRLPHHSHPLNTSRGSRGIGDDVGNYGVRVAKMVHCVAYGDDTDSHPPSTALRHPPAHPHHYWLSHLYQSRWGGYRAADRFRLGR